MYSRTQVERDPVAAPADLARTRLALYGFVLAVFDKPTGPQHGWLTSGEFVATLRGLCDRFGLELPDRVAADWPADEHESVYLACFEVGLPTPKVVLQASHYNRRSPAPRIIHEHERLYRFFGAKLAKGNLDQQDHLLNQLAFLVHLDELVVEGAADLPSIVRARRDFIERHVRNHARAASLSARTAGIPLVYASTLAVLASALDQDVSLCDISLASQPASVDAAP